VYHAHDPCLIQGLGCFLYCEIVSSWQNLILLEAFAPAAVTNQHGLTAEEMATKRGFRRLGVDALNGASSGAEE
jgi:hypothetical protein